MYKIWYSQFPHLLYFFLIVHYHLLIYYGIYFFVIYHDLPSAFLKCKLHVVVRDSCQFYLSINLQQLKEHLVDHRSFINIFFAACMNE